MRFLTIISVCAIFVLIATSIQAAELYGYVTDQSNHPRGGENIIIKADDGNSRGQNTGQDGSYSFRDINPGKYVIIIGKRKWQVYVGPGSTRRDFIMP